MSESFHVNMNYFGSVVLKGKKSSITSPNFCIFMIISPLKRTWPFKIPFSQGWFVPSLIKIGLLVQEKIFFPDINISE
jgi:hypothetical protein